MKSAAEFLKFVNAARENVQRDAYLTKKDFLDESLEKKEAKGSYIQFGYVKVEHEKMEAKLQEKLKKHKEGYDLTNGAIEKICKDADKQVEDFLKGLGWGLTQEGNLIPLADLNAEADNSGSDNAAEN